MRFFLLVFFTVAISSFSQTSNTCKCCDETHSAFDFWSGNWEVTDTNGKVLGTNTIDKLQDDCILRENWKSANGKLTGTSYNFYNAAKKQWEQIWIDNQGGSLHLKGNKVGNQMILKTDTAQNKDGKPYYHRVTWTDNEDGTVRQLWETITEEANITIAFDGIYKKIED